MRSPEFEENNALTQSTILNERAQFILSAAALVCELFCFCFVLCFAFFCFRSSVSVLPHYWYLLSPPSLLAEDFNSFSLKNIPLDGSSFVSHPPPICRLPFFTACPHLFSFSPRAKASIDPSIHLAVYGLSSDPHCSASSLGSWSTCNIPTLYAQFCCPSFGFCF